jgi:CheY-like chemotaxis protein
MGVTIESVGRAETESWIPPASGLLRTREDAFRIGEVVAEGYLIRSVLGTGGMGQVYAADDLDLHRSVAIKTTFDGGAQVRREAHALAQVHHRNVVSVHRFGLHRGLPFLVMERLYGTTLSDHIDAHRARAKLIDLNEAVDILLGIAEGLAALHDVSIAHLDLKPGNVAICADHRVVLFDLGIMVPEVEAGPRDPIGTPFYMAPELVADELVPGHLAHADLYSFGALAYELLTGAPPFTGPDVASVLAQHLAGEVPDVRDARPDVPARLAGLIRACLAKAPSDRPTRAEEVAWELRALRSARAMRSVAAANVLVVQATGDAGDLARACVQATAGACRVQTSSYDQALYAIADGPPRVIVVDVSTPGVRGIDFCAQLTGMRVLDRSCVIAVTGDDDRRARVELTRLGIRHLVPKAPWLARHLTPILRPLFPTPTPTRAASITEPPDFRRGR